MVKLFVKWGKKKFEVDADLNESPLLFKSQLFALSGVSPERQKVVIKGKTLGDEKWDGIAVSDGLLIMMMGSATEIPKPPENLGEDNVLNEMGEKPVPLPVGLKNLGNTCYMNSVLQALKSVPVLKEAVNAYSPPANATGPAFQMASQFRNLVRDLDNGKRGPDDAVLPVNMLQALHAILPQFSTRSPDGHLQQQDANECFCEMQRLVLDGLRQSTPNGNVPLSEFFRGRYAVSLKNKEVDDEPVQKTTEDFYQLSCFLSQEVKYLQTGIKEKMCEEIEKKSTVVERDCKYEKKALISRLPAFLSIQMVRFFYKQSAAVNAKILKDVKFPMVLDLFDMCTPELQEKLTANRGQFKLMEDAKIEKMRAAKQEGKDVKKAEEELADEQNALPFSFDEDPGSNNSGFYELQAVITHKGRSSDSGHYVAWVKTKGDNWAMCDDDEVHPVTAEQILKLSGGGDWHCAYVLVYGPRRSYKVDRVEESVGTEVENMDTTSVTN